MNDAENCAHCGGPKAVRNPTGKCDHLFWPENLTCEAREANGLEPCDHVFEVKGDPPYHCTFCGLSHEETSGGLFVRATK